MLSEHLNERAYQIIAAVSYELLAEPATALKLPEDLVDALHEFAQSVPSHGPEKRFK